MSARKVVVVGSGVAAVAVARRFLRRNPSHEVLMLEAGEHLQMGDYRKWLDFLMTKTAPTKAFEDSPNDADVSGTGRFVLQGGRLIVRGGSTNHWGGWCPRMKPEDFALGEVRKAAINWPITYETLSPYYVEAENFLHVCGDSAGSYTPRDGKPYPHPAIPFTAMDGLLIPALKRLGLGYESLPLARNPNACLTTGTCRYCPWDARYSAGGDLSNLLEEFEGRVEIKLGHPVVSVKMKTKESAEGVLVLPAGKPEPILEPAEIVVIAAGTMESPKILLSSTSPDWPEGLGNRTGHVGRHLVTHPLLRAVGRMDSNERNLEQEIDFPTLMCRDFDTPKFQPFGKMFFVRDGKYIRIPIGERLISKHAPSEVDSEIKTQTRIELRALMEAFPDGRNRVSLGAGKTRFGLPRTAVFYEESSETKICKIEHQARLENILKEAGLAESPSLDAGGPRSDHATGTCRMSSMPEEGVVDSNLKIHDVENVFVCSNAVFPNAGAANPTVTLVALALRLGAVI